MANKRRKIPRIRKTALLAPWLRMVKSKAKILIMTAAKTMMATSLKNFWRRMTALKKTPTVTIQMMME